MLRGINVGGHNRIKMDALREVYESIGLRNPLTYVQSGNVVFKTGERNVGGVGMRIEEAVERIDRFLDGLGQFVEAGSLSNTPQTVPTGV